MCCSCCHIIDNCSPDVIFEKMPLILSVIQGEEPRDYSYFDPEKKYYKEALFFEDMNRDTIFDCFEQLIDQIREIVPPKHRDRVIFIISQPGSDPDSPYGKKGIIWWETVPVSQEMSKQRLRIYSSRGKEFEFQDIIKEAVSGGEKS